MTPKNLRWQYVDDLQTLDTLWPYWDALAARCGADTLFNTSHWLKPWLTHFWQPDWRLAAQVAWHENQVMAILPVYIQPDKSTAFPLGQGEPEKMEVATEYLDVLLEPGEYASLAPELLLRLRKTAPKLQWRALKHDAWLLKLLANTSHTARQTTRYLSTVERFSTKQLSKNTRAQHNRGRNKLAKHHHYTMRWASDNEYAQLFATMRELHDARWKKAGKGGAFQSEQFIAFHHALIRHTDDVALSVLEIDGQAAAIHYYLKSDTTLYFYQSGWNSEQFSPFSPGLLLHCWSIQHCGCEDYDFMMGAAKNSYKAKLADSQTPMFNIEVPFSLLARLTQRLKQVLRRLR